MDQNIKIAGAIHLNTIAHRELKFGVQFVPSTKRHKNDGGGQTQNTGRVC